uniref:FLYWCH-type domain-containing protein n=1 Tax=Anopheles epiroticus TaxID=199890 RepID=A0A182PMZ0_9DIPT
MNSVGQLGSKVVYIVGQRGSILLSVNGHRYVKNRKSQSKTYWICAKKGSLGCRARVTTVLSDKEDGNPQVILNTGTHNHGLTVKVPKIKLTSSHKYRLKMDNKRNPYFKLKQIGQQQQTPTKPKLIKKSSGMKTENYHDQSTTSFHVRKFNTPVAVDSGKIKYTEGRGNNVLIYEGHRYIKNNCYGGKMYWKCSKWHTLCKARAITSISHPEQCVLKNSHNHDTPGEEYTVNESKDWR